MQEECAAQQMQGPWLCAESRAMSWNGEEKLLLANNLCLCVSWANTYLSLSLKADRSSKSLLTLYFGDYTVIKMDIFLKIREVSVNDFFFL